MPRPTLLAVALAAPATAQDLVLHHRLDETSGPVAEDASPMAQDGTYRNGVTLGVAGAAPGTGLAAEFDGVDDRDGIGPSPLLSGLTESLSVAAWVRSTATTGWHRIVGNQDNWSCGVVGRELIFTTRGVQDYGTGWDLVPDTWTHVVFVMDATFGVTLHVDGQTVTTVLGGAPANGGTAVWTVGGQGPGTELWQGALDDVQVYDGELDASDVAWLHANPGRSLPVGTSYCTTTANSAGPGATLLGFGSDVVALNALAFEVDGLPAASFGVLLASDTRGQSPLGSGTLCLAGQTTVLTGHVGFSGAAGHVHLPVDLPSLPPPIVVTAGSTWNFQYWYRDLGGTTNLSDGFEVAFR